MRPFWIGAAILGMTLVNFFQFPGHTWLQQDSQIYTPILEHIQDPAVLQKDIVARHPHVAFTLYDEIAIALSSRNGTRFPVRARRRSSSCIVRSASGART